MTTTKDGVSIKHPSVREFRTGKGWPVEISQLFDEASVAHAAGAYTASVMASRKVLMLCACQEGDADGKTFAAYVDYITNTVLTFPKARDAIDAIRKIGNDGNHKIAFSSQAESRRAMEIVSYMLNTIYSLPSA